MKYLAKVLKSTKSRFEGSTYTCSPSCDTCEITKEGYIFRVYKDKIVHLGGKKYKILDSNNSIEIKILKVL